VLGLQPRDERRVWAESFGADAARYDRARPSYRTALVERIGRASPGLDILDVGCGTGIVARQFQSAGAHVLGVDVDERMADEARRSGLEVEVSTFESWDPAGRTFDAVVSGQAWHWIDPLTGAVKAASVLRPRGRIALFWNAFQPPTDLAQAFSDVHHQLLSGRIASMWDRPAIEGYAAMARVAGDGMGTSGLFEDSQEWRDEWETIYSRDDWCEQLSTFGGHSRLTPVQHGGLAAGIGAAIDAVGGSFTMRYITVCVTALISLER
jgi:SAM-dependent methyltransferase